MRRAGDAIGISHSVVSRNIRYLEDWMGVKLLLAGPRGIHLTPEGLSLYQTLRKAFGLIAATTEELRADRQGGPLRIGAVAGLAGKWLTPRLPLIQEIFGWPEVRLRTVDPIPAADLVDMDLMITYATFDRMPGDVTPLISPRVFPLVSRRWISRFDGIDQPGRLAEMPLIHEESREQWKLWLEQVGAGGDHRLTGPILSNATLAYDAADTVPSPVLATRFTLPGGAGDGRLVELFHTDVRLGWYVLFVAPRFAQHPAAAAFIDWLKQEMAATEATQDGTQRTDPAGDGA
ncbi:DNA-binding transcriptional LysR family regulator [Angulomicrobium tetraedrale]|uniref:DNA-binding transcriptional LysR family regulator n=2 Tax=Ancylobacter tetraedralis TaxID=217068 RepID=A0A839ZF79_9HYPH|nr:DNA-binding transcriptional LysR family regulator [Ancylobacter tetraedralis]